jgi:hypothetical protein
MASACVSGQAMKMSANVNVMSKWLISSYSNEPMSKMGINGMAIGE